MADVIAEPLTDEEHEELEALRAEKARRAEEERARAEREELEALREEQAKVDAQILAERAAAERAAAQRATAEDDVSPAPAPAATEDPREQTFGQRMVISSSVDDDGIPTMPVAQKVIIAAALIALVAFIVYTLTR